MKRKKKARIFREAAKLIEEGYQPLSFYGRPAYGCEAIAKASGFGRVNSVVTKICSEFESAFSDEQDQRKFGRGIFGLPRNENNQNERVVALCFAAAMAEAGDL